MLIKGWLYTQGSPKIQEKDWIYESWLLSVKELFKKRAPGNTCLVRCQGPIDYLAKREGERYLQLKPDITLLQDEKVLFVLDAKYKEISNVDYKLFISQSDVYQMLAYSIRYECNNVILAYPKFLNDHKSGLITEFSIKNYDQIVRIKVVKVNHEAEPSLVTEEINKIIDIKEYTKNTG